MAGDWLRIFRAHTACATLILFMTMWMLGGGRLFSLEGIILGSWAIIFHYLSFGDNTVKDSAMIPYIGATKTFDMADPGKQNHPIIAGRVSIASAQRTIRFMLWALMVATIFVIYFSPGNRLLSALCLLSCYASGEAYNSGLSKFTSWRFLPISVCFASLGLFAFYLQAERMTALAALAAVYLYLRIHFQIDVSGNLKEIEHPLEKRYNMLRKLGAEVRQEQLEGFKVIKGDLLKRFYPGYIPIYAGILTFMEILVGTWILIGYTKDLLAAICFAILIGLGIFYVYQLVRKRTWRRNETLKDMAIAEICFIFALPVALAPIIGFLAVFAILLFSIGYYILLNRIEWHTVLRPQV